MPPRNKPLPSMTSKAYADGAGIFCPACRSSSGITGDSEVDTDGSVARQKCSCGCGASWVDDYRLVGYYELEVPKEEVDA